MIIMKDVPNAISDDPSIGEYSMYFYTGFTITPTRDLIISVHILFPR